VSWSHTKTGIFEFPVADGGLLRDWIGDEQTDGAVVEGIHVVLPPLLRGKHTVSWHAESVSCGADTDGDGTPEPLVKDFVYKLDWASTCLTASSQWHGRLRQGVGPAHRQRWRP
jgi:hypothetical protein